MASRALVVRYAEIALKGKNRSEFERALRANLEARLAGVAHGAVERSWGRVLVRFAGDAAPLIARAREVFGIASLSAAVSVAPELAAIAEAAITLVEAALARQPGDQPISFRVTAKRADKAFPMTSLELDRELGAAILSRCTRLKARMRQPELELGVELRRHEALLYLESVAGPGGLPVGTAGKAVLLLSGGIDSPVAGYLAMKRGLSIVALTFHSFPYTGDALKEKVYDLARVLARHQPRTKLLAIPLTDVQVAIKATAPESLRTLLYRRAMHRIATAVAMRERAGALVTGESLGQVASQTLENLALIEQASPLITLRPLLCFDKRDTIALARSIGTFDLSIRPAADCCTLFQPERPAIRGKLETALQAESQIDLAALEAAALAQAEMVELTPESSAAHSFVSGVSVNTV
ncbi:MAG: tRNA uracil 4-sulfurtransferase ThiI [Planctomycetota bacterium]